MDEALRERLIKLKKLSEFLSLKKGMEEVLNIDKETYIQNDINMKKPEKMEEVIRPNPPFLYKVFKTKVAFIIYSAIGVLVLSAFIILLVWLISLGLFEDDEGIPIFFLMISCCVMCCLFPAYNAYYPKRLEKYKDIEHYNNEVYPKDLEEYTAHYSSLEKEYQEKMEKAQTIYDELCKGIKNYADVLHPKYYDGVDGIIEIIESERADSFKEALNLYVQEQSDLAYKKAQMEAKVAHDAAMEELAWQQAENAKNMQANMQCSLCKHNPCLFPNFNGRCTSFELKL